MFVYMSDQHQYDEDLVLDKLLNSNNSILLYNDEVNTFDHVIDSLCKYCDHDSVQAEQCAWIVHNNGKCMVKRDEYSSIKPMYDALLDAGLSVKIL